MGSQARVDHIQCDYFVRQTVAYNTPNIATGIVIGHIPAGCAIARITAYVTVAQNAGTTNTFSVGTIPEANGVLSAGITAVTNLVNAAAAGTAAKVTNDAPIANTIMATDAAVVVSLAQSGAAATAGQVTFVVSYTPNL